MVLLLIETAAGFALFKVLKEKKLKEAKVTPCPKEVTTRPSS